MYKDNITRAEIEAIAGQTYTLMSRTGTKGRNVVASKPTRQNRIREDSGKGD